MKLPTEQVTKVDSVKAGQMVRALREKKNVSLRRLAYALKISPPFLSDMELGRRGWSPERFSLAVEILKESK